MPANVYQLIPLVSVKARAKARVKARVARVKERVKERARVRVARVARVVRAKDLPSFSLITKR
jgi:hypothetical protein